MLDILYIFIHNYLCYNQVNLSEPINFFQRMLSILALMKDSIIKLT